MPYLQVKFSRSRAACVIAAAGSILILSMAIAAPAEARGGHSFHHGLGGHEMHGGDGGGSFAGNRRHGNDAYVRAASEEEDKLLNTKIKSICHGC
ncbi:MAG TPA: hypothetical protein VNZ53_06660 [Steroidobacteraceae bacterium]|jgi:hypothetical protein|nr:hypothetical protein [Steroidobacteraceae bacterium]